MKPKYKMFRTDLSTNAVLLQKDGPRSTFVVSLSWSSMSMLARTK